MNDSDKKLNVVPARPRARCRSRSRPSLPRSWLMNDASRHGPESAPVEVSGLAGIFSFLVPGLGDLFIGAWSRAVVWFAGWLPVSQAGGGGVHPVVVVLMFVAGVDAFVYRR